MGVYQLKTDLGNLKIPEEDLRPGSAQMFFGEPDGWTHVFHEKHGRNLELVKKADNIYELKCQMVAERFIPKRTERSYT